MNSIDAISAYLSHSSLISFLVLAFLSIYFISVVWVFFYRYFSLNAWIGREQKALEGLYMGNSQGPAMHHSALSKCSRGKNTTVEMLDVCKSEALRESTFGLTFLSIVASTAPFIGLFGTVVSILESFAKLGQESKASLSVIAPVISEALIATAGGILVAIPAYSFHLIMKRKAFELNSVIQTQVEFLIAKHETQERLQKMSKAEREQE